MQALFGHRDDESETLSAWWNSAIRWSVPAAKAVLLGFARATGDAVYRAVIWDVVVDPAHQGQGIGRQLVETLIAHPLLNTVERVYLMTTFQQGFYEQLGFVKNASTTMVLTRN
jgi:GNAT superfamily N-acetyltransferase